MDFKEQVSDLKILTIIKPRVYLQWINTENGRGNLFDYNHTVKVHTYNNTLEIIKQIENIIGVVSY